MEKKRIGGYDRIGCLPLRISQIEIQNRRKKKRRCDVFMCFYQRGRKEEEISSKRFFLP
jgi:hypothetical protein